MGSIDNAVYTLTCSNCSTSEDAWISDKGSGWNGSYWGESAHFTQFDTIWSGGGAEEPELQSKQCKNCGSTNVKIKKEYKPFG